MLSLSLPPLPHSASSPLYPEIFPLSCPLSLLRSPDPRRGGGGGGGGGGEEGRGQRSMSAMAVSSSLNPDAPLFIPAAFRQVEDFSPQWWDLVKSTAWFRDHWFHQHQQLDDMADSLLAFEVQNDDDVASLLPDAFDDDLFYDHHQHSPVAFDAAAQQPPAALKTDAVLKAALSLTSPKGGDAPRGLRDKPRHSEKPTKYAGSPRSGGAPRVIHQPR